MYKNSSSDAEQLWLELMNLEPGIKTEFKESDYVYRRFKHILRPYLELKYWITQRKLMRLGILIKESDKLPPLSSMVPQETHGQAIHANYLTSARKRKIRKESRRLDSMLWLSAMAEEPGTTDFEHHAGWYIYRRYGWVIRPYLKFKRCYTQWVLKRLGASASSLERLGSTDGCSHLQSAGGDSK